MPSLPQIVAHAKEHGFIYPSSTIYGGLQAVYDYGPYGVLLKKRIQSFWWQSMVQLYPNIVGLDAAILMDAKTWEASGHVAGFHDWMVDHKVSKKRYRVDTLLESEAARWEQEGRREEAVELLQAMRRCMDNDDNEGLTALLIKAAIKCPLARTSEWTPCRRFNLMFATQVGSTATLQQKVYLRPETAQGIFVNFLQVQQSTRSKIPFGIAQIGKAFRNEIVARQFIFRMREFEQMEMQFFVAPGLAPAWFAYWQAQRQGWYQALGISKEEMYPKQHEQLAHYADAAVDLTYAFPFGWKEVEGIHSRTDFDLKSHEQLAGKRLRYFDPHQNSHYIPHVVETSVGCDRLLLMLLFHAWREGVKEDGTTRTWLSLPPPLAPLQAAIFPLLNKEPLTTHAQNLFRTLSYHFVLDYQATGSIGKRYARQDLLGTPYCITVDHQTLEDDTVTVRVRDTMAQLRLPTKEVTSYLEAHTAIASLLKKLPTLPPPC